MSAFLLGVLGFGGLVASRRFAGSYDAVNAPAVAYRVPSYARAAKLDGVHSNDPDVHTRCLQKQPRVPAQASIDALRRERARVTWDDHTIRPIIEPLAHDPFFEPYFSSTGNNRVTLDTQYALGSFDLSKGN